jgi:gliding motility associated protien GldN
MNITKQSMRNRCLFFLAVAGFLLAAVPARAQERDDQGYNPMSVYPVHTWDQLYKKTLWLRLDGKEKQNKPLFARNNEITKHIIEAVKAGLVRPFENDSLMTRMPYESFIERLTMPGTDAGLSDEEKAMGFTEEEDDWGGGDGGWDDEYKDDKSAGGAAAASDEYLPKEITILEIREDLIFDKKHSRIVHDIQAISLFLPANKNPAGVEKLIASFSYKELVDNVFKDNANAFWYNDANIKEHRNLSDAFDLRLFAAHLVKYSNGADAYIEEIYGTDAGNAQQAAIVASMQVEHALLEWEAELWEY